MGKGGEEKKTLKAHGKSGVKIMAGDTDSYYLGENGRKQSELLERLQTGGKTQNSPV